MRMAQGQGHDETAKTECRELAEAFFELRREQQEVLLRLILEGTSSGHRDVFARYVEVVEVCREVDRRSDAA